MTLYSLKRYWLYIILVLFFFLGDSPVLFAQAHSIDSNYIHLFDKKNVIELYPGIYSTRFNFSNPRERKNNYSLVANSSGYVGIYLAYKWISLKYSWSIPGTELAKNVKLQSTSLGFSFGMRKISFRPFYDSYKGLLVPQEARSRNFKPVRDIKFTNAGTDLIYFFNRKKFSSKAAVSFSEKQVKSIGSLFLKITPVWQKINWEDPSRDLISDSTTFKLLSADPEWVSLIARIGYSYTISFKEGKWVIAPVFLIGGGALREINTGIHHLQLVTAMDAGLRSGYNGHTWYLYFNARWANLQTNLIIKNMHQVNAGFSITAGYRFSNLKHKILRVL